MEKNFDRFIWILLFFNLILNKDLKKVPLELSIFIFPSTIWILLIIFKSDYQNISDYIEHFIVMYESMGVKLVL